MREGPGGAARMRTNDKGGVATLDLRCAAATSAIEEGMGAERVAFASVLVIALAYLATRKEPCTSNLDSVLRGLLREENFRTVNGENRVAVGFGSCVDYFSDTLEAVEALDLQPPGSPQHHDVIHSMWDLSEALAFHFSHGGAAERYCSDERLFEQWAGVLRKLNSTEVRIGGNAPVIARRFAMEGWKVLLGAKMDPQTARNKLHPFIKVAGNATDSTEEDIHLLFEYNLGDNWGPYTAPRANRFIVHNDYCNMMLESLESFIESLGSFQPALVVVSGLQMLDNFPLDTAIRTSKLWRLQQALFSLPPSVKIHFEMASITEEKLIRELLEYVIPYADSLGMNEQELANLCSMLEFGNVTIVSDPYPRVAKALDQIRSLHTLLEARKSASRGHRELSRIHVHTLAYQAILVTRDSIWRNMNGAVAKASLTAHRYICASNKISMENARIIMDESFSVSAEPGSHRMPLVDSAPVSCWSEDAVRFCVAPNLVCTAVRQTGGGGDNVSAAGLVLQL